MSKRQAGFTLLEVLIAVMITSLVGFLLVQALVQNNGLYISQVAKVTQGLSLNDVSILISNDIKSASSVAVGYPASAPTLLSSDTSLVLQVPALDASGNVMTSVYDYYIITQDTSNPKILREYLYPDPSSSRKSHNRVLITNLADIQFSYLGSSNQIVTPSNATQVNYAVSVSNPVGSSTQQSVSSGQVSLRNE